MTVESVRFPEECAAEKVMSTQRGFSSKFVAKEHTRFFPTDDVDDVLVFYVVKSFKMR